MQHNLVENLASLRYSMIKEGCAMKRLGIAEPEVMEIALKNEILRSEEARYDHRLHGVLLICRGLSCYEVGDIFGQHPTTIQRWVQKFEDHGFNALQDHLRPGRPRRLTPKQLQVVARDLRKSPRELGYTENLWDGKLLSHHLKKNQEIVMGVRQSQRLFRQLGFRLRKPRPVIAKASPEKQATFKKNSVVSPKKQRGSMESG